MGKKKTFEQAIRDNADKFGVIGSEYVIRVRNDGGGLHIYIRPNSRDGETLDYIVEGNTVTQLINFEL